MARVSIGLPVWNGEAFLTQALDSIRAQTFEDFELVIADNASTDSTPDIIADYARRDPRIRAFRHKENLGAAGNFNFVFHKSTAPYFRWAAYDDMIAPGYLAACVKALDDDDGSAALAFPQTLMIDCNAKPLRVYDAVTRKSDESPSARLDGMIGPGDHLKSYLHMCFPVFGLMRRSALEGTSLIANMPRSDHLLLVELCLKGRFIEVPQPLFLRREHDSGSVISAEKAATSGEDLEKLLAAWFDPNKKGRFPATATRLGLGYFRAAARTPMPLGEKLACMRIAGGWLARHWRVIGGECKILLRERMKPA
ncbi:glycosyltransferase family 2 protein [Psychromarinibacter sp. S121]|uniref:glycosyltransferase family 2 protein n=1 Tax=Psychromarinibacter sp. S121 TaxID=3415127 RepID=UPI003C7B5EF6